MAQTTWRSLTERLALAEAGDPRAVGGTGGVRGCLTDEAFKIGALLRAACDSNEREGTPVTRPPCAATPLIG